MSEPRDPNFEERVRRSFERQRAMRTMGATLVRVSTGEVELELPYRDELTQQYGFLHAGVVAAVVDSARGYAALSLMPGDAAVLSVEFKLEGGYVTADVIDVTPETPGLEGMLDRFRKEHWHDEDEVRFIVEGQGLFHASVGEELRYPDVAPALARWSRDGRRIAIFSSGSALAQELLFRHSTAGDLAGHLSGYFDTTLGPKREPRSYDRIAEALGVEPSEVLFVSDVIEELDAAAETGMSTALSVREGVPLPQSTHRAVRSFEELD